MTTPEKALDEIEAALKRVQSLVAEGAKEGFVKNALPVDYYSWLFYSNQTTSKALSLLPTLRAALTQPAAVEDGWQDINTAPKEHLG